MKHDELSADAPRPQRVRLFRIEPGTSTTIMVLESHIHGLYIHWNTKKSVYCAYRSQEGCPHCKRFERHFRGYLAGNVLSERDGYWYPHVIELTPHCDREMRDHIQRGDVWRLWRKRQGKKHTPIFAELHDRYKPSTFPPPWDPTPVLEEIFGVTKLFLDETNPLPAKTVMAPVSLPGTVKGIAEKGDMAADRSLAASKLALELNRVASPLPGDDTVAAKSDNEKLRDFDQFCQKHQRNGDVR